MDQPKCVENLRRMRVVVIGAGYSGIYCGIRIPQRLRNVELAIYEKNAGVGGACLYAPAAEIRAYLESVAKRYSVHRFIRLSHKVVDVTWKQDISKWHVTIEDLRTGNMIVDEADVVISGRGSLNEKAWPDIPGIHDMKIPVMHSAEWDESVDFNNKKVGVIGGGSSAIQIIPSLQQLPGTNLDCFIRSKTWISNRFGDNVMKTLGLESTDFSEEQKKRFATDSEYYLHLRSTIERDHNSIHSLTLKDTELQKMIREDFTESMRKRLSKKPHVLESLLPDFGVTCRRLTPGPGYLEALVEDNVSFISTPITQAKENSLVLQNGEERPLDVLVCATGFKTSAPPPFSVKGRNGVTMQDKFDPYPETYLSLVTDGFPNYFMMLGPNGAIGTGPLTTMIERTGDYIIKCIRKIQKEGISSMEVKSARVKDFSAIIDNYFKGTVYLDGCNSWYRSNAGKGDRIIGVWPGSALHAMETLRSPRWEDYEYEYEDRKDGGERNMLAWIGDGWSIGQVDEGAADLAYYLQPGIIDIPAEPFPEETAKTRKLPFSH